MDFEEKFPLERGKMRGFLGFPNPAAVCSDKDWLLGLWSFLVFFFLVCISFSFLDIFVEWRSSEGASCCGLL